MKKYIRYKKGRKKGGQRYRVGKKKVKKKAFLFAKKKGYIPIEEVKELNPGLEIFKRKRRW